MAEALAAVKHDLGSDAIILNTDHSSAAASSASARRRSSRSPPRPTPAPNHSRRKLADPRRLRCSPQSRATPMRRRQASRVSAKPCVKKLHRATSHRPGGTHDQRHRHGPGVITMSIDHLRFRRSPKSMWRTESNLRSGGSDRAKASVAIHRAHMDAKAADSQKPDNIDIDAILRSVTKRNSRASSPTFIVGICRLPHQAKLRRQIRRRTAPVAKRFLMNIADAGRGDRKGSAETRARAGESAWAGHAAEFGHSGGIVRAGA